MISLARRTSSRFETNGNSIFNRDLPSGCTFHPRCPMAVDKCRESDPLLVDIGGGRSAACHRVDETAEGSAAETAGTADESMTDKETA